jgi:hypothetical protein
MKDQYSNQFFYDLNKEKKLKLKTRWEWERKLKIVTKTSWAISNKEMISFLNFIYSSLVKRSSYAINTIAQTLFTKNWLPHFIKTVIVNLSWKKIVVNIIVNSTETMVFNLKCWSWQILIDDFSFKQFTFHDKWRIDHQSAISVKNSDKEN